MILVPQHVNKQTNKGNTVALIATADSKNAQLKSYAADNFAYQGMLKSNVNSDKALFISPLG